MKAPSLIACVCALFVSFAAASVAVQPAQAAAMLSAALSSKPLVVVRFNQRKVFFQQPLYNAVSRAIETKPAVRFTVISYVPVSGDTARDQQFMAKASQNTRAITDSMARMGVPSQQMSVSTEAATDLQYDEVHIYVE